MHHRHSRFTLRVPPNVSSCSTTASTLLLNDMGSLHFVASGQPWKLCVTANFDRFVNILQRSMMDRSSDFVAGIVAGAASNFLLHPLDVIKVRYQVADGSAGKVRYRSTVNAVKTILANEGVRGLFKGAVPGLLPCTACFHVLCCGFHVMSWLLSRCLVWNRGNGRFSKLGVLFFLLRACEIPALPNIRRSIGFTPSYVSCAGSWHADCLHHQPAVAHQNTNAASVPESRQQLPWDGPRLHNSGQTRGFSRIVQGNRASSRPDVTRRRAVHSVRKNEVMVRPFWHRHGELFTLTTSYVSALVVFVAFPSRYLAKRHLVRFSL